MPPSPISQTLSRLSRRSGDLLMNPLLEGEVGAGLLDDPAQGHLHELGGGTLFRAAPGWYLFGSYPHTEVSGGAATARDIFLGGGTFTGGIGHNQGVQIRQYGTNAGGYLRGGIVQVIPNGRALRGKKVRVSAAFQVTLDDFGVVTAGVSIWLKGLIRFRDLTASTPANLFGLDGVVTAGNTNLNSATADFITAGIAAGDMLVVGGQTSNFYPGVYEVASVSNANNLTIRVPNGNTGFQNSGNPVPFGLARNTSNAVSPSGSLVRLSTSGDIPALIHSIVPAGSAVTDPRLWFWRGWDFLQAPRHTQSPAFVAVMQGRYQAAAASYNGSFPQPFPTGAPAARVFYVDGSQWTNVPTDGNMLLLNDDTKTQDTGVIHYAESIVEIPDDLLMTTDDLFVIVLPKDPRTSFAAGLDRFDVSVHAVSMELIPEESSVPVSGLVAKHLQGVGGGTTGSPQSSMQNVLHALRYPIYEEVALPLQVQAPITNTTGLTKISFPDTHTLRINGAVTAQIFRFLQESLPIGSHILRALLRVTAYTPDGSGVANGALDSSLTVGSGGVVIDNLLESFTGITAPEIVDLGRLYEASGPRLPVRHRIGWPTRSNTFGGEYPQPAALVFSLTVDGGASFDLRMEGGQLIAWVDPRLIAPYLHFGVGII